MKALLHHGELVVSRSRLAADLDVLPQQDLGILESLARHAEIGQFQQGFRKVGIVAERLLKKFFGSSRMALPLLDVAKIEQAGSVVGIPLESSLKVLAGFIESPQTAVGNAHESVGLRGRGEIDQLLKFCNGLFCFLRFEIALSQGGVEIGALR